jgi:Uma2 family endonuclease
LSPRGHFAYNEAIDTPKGSSKEKFTYADYRTWPEDERWELIRGEAFSMSPAPTSNHQRIVTDLTLLLSLYFSGKPCEVLVSPVDVLLTESPGTADEDADTVVQPDLLVVCDPAQTEPWGVRGGSTLVVEVLSESTAGRDLTTKLELYESHGVEEFRVIHPTRFYLQVFSRSGGSAPYSLPVIYGRGQTWTTPLFPGLAVPVDEIFRRVVKGA